MRTFLQALVLSCALASTASGAPPPALTFHAGSSVPNLRDHGGNQFSSGWSSRVGAFFGIGAEMSLPGRPWSLVAEVNYSAQGGRKDGLQAVNVPLPLEFTPYADFKNTAKLDYIEIPVLARMPLSPARRVFLEFGPYAGILLSAKNVTEGSGPLYADRQRTPITGEGGEPIVLDYSGTTDNKSSLNAMNWGLLAGLGARQPLGRGALVLQVRGELGMMDIQKHPEVDGRNGTGALIVALGYELPL